MIYLDANADAPVLPEAWAAYAAATAEFGNPSSAHAAGRAARERFEAARASIAGSLGAAPSEIVFTSGGTEADALALRGVSARSTVPHVVTSTIEHAAVAQNLAALAGAGRIRLTRVAPGPNGRVALEAVRAAITPDTRLVTLVLACNETGVVQPVAELASLCHDQEIVLHTDAVQAVGRMPLDCRMLGVDALSLSAHKVGAVGGVGVLYVRAGGPVELRPLVAGGAQEAGRRPGTENVLGAASLAAALAHLPDDGERARLQGLRDRLEAALAAAPGVEVLGAGAPRLCNTSCVRFAGCEGDGLMMGLDLAGICVSTGSACSSGSVEPSPILLGMGLSPARAKEALRFSLPPRTTAEEIDRTAAVTLELVARARSLTGWP